MNKKKTKVIRGTKLRLFTDFWVLKVINEVFRSKCAVMNFSWNVLWWQYYVYIA